MRLRHDGFLATRHKARTLRRCRERFGLPSGALVSLLPVSGHIGGLETVLSPLHLPLPPTLAAESLHASCDNPHKDPLPRGAAAQCNRVLSLMGDHEG